MNRYLN